MKCIPVILSHVLSKPGHVIFRHLVTVQVQNTLSLTPKKFSVSFVERACWLARAPFLIINASGQVWSTLSKHHIAKMLMSGISDG